MHPVRLEESRDRAAELEEPGNVGRIAHHVNVEIAPRHQSKRVAADHVHLAVRRDGVAQAGVQQAIRFAVQCFIGFRNGRCHALPILIRGRRPRRLVLARALDAGALALVVSPSGGGVPKSTGRFRTEDRDSPILRRITTERLRLDVGPGECREDRDPWDRRAGPTRSLLSARTFNDAGMMAHNSSTRRG